MNIAIISKNKDKFSETFIHNQVKHLPFTNHFLYGDYLPTHYGNNQPFLENSFFSSLSRQIRQQFLAATETSILKEKIAGYLVKHNVKVVLANYSLSAIPFLDICKQTGIPLVVHFHGYTAYRNDIYNDNRNGYARLFKEAVYIVSVSDHMTERLKSIGAPAEKISKIIYGIDENLFNKPTIGSTQKTFLYNGRFCDTKNPHLVILAFYQVVKEIAEAQLVMVGEGELMPSCMQLVKSLGLETKITFKGVLQPSQVAEQMRNAAVLVQFSATTPNNDTEGTPLTVLEAGLSGLPVIVSRSGGLPEIILDNETGYLVDELDVEALAQKMKDALLNREKSLQMAARLREYLLMNYTLKKYTERLSGLLIKAADSKK